MSPGALPKSRPTGTPFQAETSKEPSIFEQGGCFFLMLGLRSAVTEISGNTIFVEPQVADQDLQVDLRRGLQLLCTIWDSGCRNNPPVMAALSFATA